MASWLRSKPKLDGGSKPRKQLGDLDEVKTEAQMLEAAQATVSALSFDGFDVVKMRELAISSIPLGPLMVLLSAYSTTGNSLSKRVTAKKVSDRETADRVVRMMKDGDIKERATTSEDVTLPRLAICFPALVIWIRLRANVEPRLVSSTPPELQDICLNGWANLPAAQGAQDFIDKFALVLGKAEVKPPLIFDEAACLLKSRAFGEVGRLAQSRDPKGVAAMQKPVTKDTSLFALARLYGYTV